MSIADNIRALRKRYGISQDELAKIANVSNKAVSMWETGRNEPRIGAIQKIADHFHILKSDLIEERQELKLPPDCEPVNFHELKRIPLLGQVAAGLPLYAEENIEGYTYTELNSGAEYFALRVKGDSMDAMGIKDGYVVIVRRQSIVEDGEVAIVMIDNEEATMKRFYKVGNTVTLLPQSTNPEHKPQIYDLTRTRIEVIGKVVKVEFML